MMFSISIVMSISPDCQNVIALAQGFNLNSGSWYTNLQTDCCSGVSCTNNRVVGINWSWSTTKGIVNETALLALDQLTSLILNRNIMANNPMPLLPINLEVFECGICSLTGSLTSLPVNMTTLELGGSSLTGSLPSLPSQLSYLSLWWNSFSGDMPLLPESLKFIDVGNNLLSGSFPQLPAGLTFGWFYSNQLIGQFPLILPVNLTSFSVTNNPLTGPFPVTLGNSLQFADLCNLSFTGNLPILPGTLTELRISGNYLTGGLENVPVGIQKLMLNGPANWANGDTFSHNQFTGSLLLAKPTYLDISFNQITNLTILDTSALTYCNISYNPLLNQTGIANLTMCDQRGLYIQQTAISSFSLYKTSMHSTTSLNHKLDKPYSSTALLVYIPSNYAENLTTIEIVFMIAKLFISTMGIFWVIYKTLKTIHYRDDARKSADRFNKSRF